MVLHQGISLPAEATTTIPAAFTLLTRLRALKNCWDHILHRYTNPRIMITCGALKDQSWLLRSVGAEPFKRLDITCGSQPCSMFRSPIHFASGAMPIALTIPHHSAHGYAFHGQSSQGTKCQYHRDSIHIVWIAAWMASCQL
jgi:hypothetical protein